MKFIRFIKIYNKVHHRYLYTLESYEENNITFEYKLGSYVQCFFHYKNLK